MNNEEKEHVVTEIYYPLGGKVPHLRRTGKPLRINDPEFFTLSGVDFEKFKHVFIEEFYAGAPLSEMMPEQSKPVYRQLEVDEMIQDGDEFLNHKQEWHTFNDSVGETLKYSRFRCFETRTTRPKPTKPAPNYDPKGDEGKKKPQLQLIPPVLNNELAKALSFGAAKYEPWNWRKNKVEYMTYLGAMKRHIDALLEREDVASDSGVHHLGHIAASCAIVLDATKHGTLVDNRPPGKLNSEPVVDSGAFNGVE